MATAFSCAKEAAWLTAIAANVAATVLVQIVLTGECLSSPEVCRIEEVIT